MLYIHYFLASGVDPHIAGQYGIDTDMKEREWQVGHARPSEQLDDANIHIHTIIADGKELAHIISHFSNLPYIYDITGRPCVWRGEMARFIFDNL